MSMWAVRQRLPIRAVIEKIFEDDETNFISQVVMHPDKIAQLDKELYASLKGKKPINYEGAFIVSDASISQNSIKVIKVTPNRNAITLLYDAETGIPLN